MGTRPGNGKVRDAFWERQKPRGRVPAQLMLYEQPSGFWNGTESEMTQNDRSLYKHHIPPYVDSRVSDMELYTIVYIHWI